MVEVNGVSWYVEASAQGVSAMEVSRVKNETIARDFHIFSRRNECDIEGNEETKVSNRSEACQSDG